MVKGLKEILAEKQLKLKGIFNGSFLVVAFFTLW